MTLCLHIARIFRRFSGSSTNPIVLAALPTAAVCHRCGKGGHKADICWVNIHANGSRLDSSTITAKAKDMKHKKFSKDNKIDVARMSRDDREQLMANLTIAELENKGKIDNYPLYYLLSRISKSNVFLDELFPEELFSDRELFSDAKSFLSEVFVGQNGSFSPTKAKLFLSKPGLFSDLQLFSDELFSDELFLSQDLFLDKLFSDKSDAFLAQCCRLILDSGAGLHLSPSITATNFDNQIMVSGFNGSTAPTRGSGALSCVFQDANDGQNFTFTLDDVNKFDGVIASSFHSVC